MVIMPQVYIFMLVLPRCDALKYFLLLRALFLYSYSLNLKCTIFMRIMFTRNVDTSQTFLYIFSKHIQPPLVQVSIFIK